MLCKPTLPVPPGESNVRFHHAVGTNNIRAARSVTANVFQIRCTAGEIVLCCGLSLPENLNRPDAAGGADEQLLAVGLDRRIVMNQPGFGLVSASGSGARAQGAGGAFRELGIKPGLPRQKAAP